ncbi:MAG TPA: hypothetical protein VK108_00075 [Pseudogracilibacillus sp.]|nr:hypothetical protein [Pseudogracilibacillus sp.]
MDDPRVRHIELHGYPPAYADDFYANDFFGSYIFVGDEVIEADDSLFLYDEISQDLIEVLLKKYGGNRKII